MADSSNTTSMSEAIRLLRERAKQAADAAGAILRWSYLLEMHQRCVEAGVPLPEDGRNFLSRPLVPMKKAASTASDTASPFLTMVANEALQMLEPQAVDIAAQRRQQKRQYYAERDERWQAREDLARAIRILGAETVIERATSAMESRENTDLYLAIAKQMHDEKTAAAANVVTFPGART